MSGFAGIVNLDGAPVDRRLVRRMTAALAFRGPDAANSWIGGCAGLSHALLRTTVEAARERQPFTSDDQVWIVGDARVDARAELIAQLPGPVPPDLAAAPDIELVLRAYQAWGERSVDRLLGDFAFAIWDGRRRRLFAARDHLGVRPFYYAHAGSSVIFSNTLECVRLHPGVSTRANDLAIADFLLFDVNQDPSTTAFADVKRLAPAHSLTATCDRLATTRYWMLPIDEPLFYRRLDDYTDRFQSLLRTAVDDRLRTSAVGVFMSGGTDSTCLAAMANRLLGERGSDSGVRAFTWAEDSHDGGREGHYAGLVAQHLGIPIDVYRPDAEPIDWLWEGKSRSAPEPDSCAWRMAAGQKYHRRVAASLRVFFYGEGPDNALYYEWQPYLRYLARGRRIGRLAVDASRYVVTQGRVPLWNRLPLPFARSPEASAEASRAASADPSTDIAPSYPGWLNADFERRYDLRERWRAVRAGPPQTHPVRPKSYASLCSPLWQKLFEGLDAERTRATFEARHPFVDLRVLRFMLAVPAIPWCRRKYLIRRSMRRELPDLVLRRTKKSLPPSRLLEVQQRLAIAPFASVPSLSDYVDVRRVLDASQRDARAVQGWLRIRSLNHWLQDHAPRADDADGLVEEPRREQRV